MHMLVSLALSLSTVCLCACVWCELAVAMTLKDSTRLYAFPAKRTQIQHTHTDTHCCTGVIVVWSLIAQPCGKLSCSSNWIYS